MRSPGIKHENFFIAKICDSESARSAFGSRRLVTMISLAPCAHDERITKSTAVQAFPAILTIDNVDLLCIFRIVHRARRDVVARKATHAFASPCQHFLKWEAVFFDALVLFERECTSIPECTQRLSHLTTLGGQHG